MFTLPFLAIATLVTAIIGEERHQVTDKFGILPPGPPGTTPAARLGQQFQAATLSAPGSPMRGMVVDQAAGTAYAMRMRGENIGEKGFAAIRASRPGYVGSSGGHISPAWGRPWNPEAGLQEDHEEQIDAIIDEMFGAKHITDWPETNPPLQVLKTDGSCTTVYPISQALREAKKQFEGPGVFGVGLAARNPQLGEQVDAIVVYGKPSALQTLPDTFMGWPVIKRKAQRPAGYKQDRARSS